jgi:hypothetical protein
MFGSVRVSRRVLVCILIAVVGCNLSCGLAGLLSALPTLSRAGTTTTIILVRHAERDEGLDPPLNAEGLVRRQALLEVLRHNGVTAIYAADLLRNRETIDPLVDELGLTPVLITAPELADTKALASRLVAEWVTLHAGGVVLWVGNTGPITETQSGNLQEIYARLGGTGAPPTRYQDIYTVVVPDEGDAHFIQAEYGGESSLD